MDRAYIDVNLPNVISITIMAVVGLFVMGILVKYGKQAMGNA